MNNLCFVLKQLRKERNIKQKDIAIAIKVNERTYSNYENGRTQPDLDTLISIADYYKTSTDYLLGRIKSD